MDQKALSCISNGMDFQSYKSTGDQWGSGWSQAIDPNSNYWTHVLMSFPLTLHLWRNKGVWHSAMHQSNRISCKWLSSPIPHLQPLWSEIWLWVCINEAHRGPQTRAYSDWGIGLWSITHNLAIWLVIRCNYQGNDKQIKCVVEFQEVLSDFWFVLIMMLVTWGASL